MVTALIALPADGSGTVLSTVLNAAPEVMPVAILGDMAAVVEVPEEAATVLDQLPGVAVSTTDVVPNLAKLNLPEKTLFWLEGWNRLLDPSRVMNIATRPNSWWKTNIPCDLAEPPLPSFGGPTLTETIAVGVLIVDGTGEAALQPSDYADISLSMIHAFDILYRNAPSSAHLVFLADQRRITLPLSPAAIPRPETSTRPSSDLESRERAWRDSALKSIGLAPGFPGIDEYRDTLMKRSWAAGPPRKAVVALITKYNTGWYAYAANGRFVVQIEWARSQVGYENLDRVIAHEISHLFGALDEYEGCEPAKVSGPFSVLNGNCFVFPTLPHVPCLMDGGTDDMCLWTKAHVGWNPLT